MPDEDQEDAFLEESLEATTMHEPPAYPADKLEWLGQYAREHDRLEQAHQLAQDETTD